MINLLAWIVVGGLAGWIASLIMKNNAQMGCLTNVMVGMVGSLVGGTLVSLITTGQLNFLDTSYNDLNFSSLVVSVLGAVVFIGLLRLFKR